MALCLQSNSILWTMLTKFGDVLRNIHMTLGLQMFVDVNTYDFR